MAQAAGKMSPMTDARLRLRDRVGRASANCASLVFSWADHPERPAVLDESGMVQSFDDLRASVDSVVTVLREAGFSRDDRLALIIPRGPVGIVAFLAGSSVSSLCPMHAGMRADELDAYIAMLGVTGIIDGTDNSIARDIARRRDLPLVVLRRTDHIVATVVSGHATSKAGLSELTAADDVALLMQTSGTTSKPKLVPLTHRNLISAAANIADWFALGTDDLCLNPMPLHHLHGLITAGLSSLFAGAAVCFTTGFAPDLFHETLERIQPTWFTGSPTMHLALRDLYAGGRAAVPTQRLRFFRSSSAPLPVSIIEQLEALFQAPLMETYGTTETGSMICANPLPPGVRKSGSVGVAVGAEIRVVNEQGADVPDGENGEVVVRGPSVIHRYLGAADVSAPFFFGDWLRTGDIGRFDADRYLYIVGRTKELIKRGGLAVYPDEIDNALVSHPAVAEAVTFSLVHPTLGEELVAAVVPAAGHAPTEEQLKAHLSASLSGYKVPAAMLIVERLPKTETGKIVRREAPSYFAEAFRPSNIPANGEGEEALLAIWRDILSRSDFGVTDNVLLLGADPIRARSAAEALRSRLGQTLPTHTIIAHPTVRAMAALLSPARGAA